MKPTERCDDILRISRMTDRCSVLGPGTRAVIWVQGCPLRCRGCVSPHTLSFDGGIGRRVEELAEHLINLRHIEGVTFSGGEPTSQAAALVRLIDAVRSRRDLSFISYSGFTLEALLAGGDADHLNLLLRLDLLIDGPFIQDRQTDLRWRGSDNQRIILLSHRYAHLKATFNDRGVWLEAEVAADGTVAWQGIPPRDFPDKFARKICGPKVVLPVKGASL